MERSIGPADGPRCVEQAMAAATRSPCAKSRRGAVIYEPDTGTIRGTGFNGPPEPMTCTRTEFCARKCGMLCEHAEGRAVRDAWNRVVGKRLDLVHVKVDQDGRLVAGGPPKCWQCSRVILEVKFIARVWLYQTAESINAVPIKRLPAYIHQRVDADMWIWYSPEDFHWVSRLNAGILESPLVTGSGW